MPIRKSLKANADLFNAKIDRSGKDVLIIEFQSNDFMTYGAVEAAAKQALAASVPAGFKLVHLTTSTVWAHRPNVPHEHSCSFRLERTL